MVYNGIFDKSLREGNGTMVNPSSSYKFEAFWKKDQLHGIMREWGWLYQINDSYRESIWENGDLILNYIENTPSHLSIAQKVYIDNAYFIKKSIYYSHDSTKHLDELQFFSLDEKRILKIELLYINKYKQPYSNKFYKGKHPHFSQKCLLVYESPNAENIGNFKSYDIIFNKNLSFLRRNEKLLATVDYKGNIIKNLTIYEIKVATKELNATQRKNRKLNKSK